MFHLSIILRNGSRMEFAGPDASRLWEVYALLNHTTQNVEVVGIGREGVDVQFLTHGTILAKARFVAAAKFLGA